MLVVTISYCYDGFVARHFCILLSRRLPNKNKTGCGFWELRRYFSIRLSPFTWNAYMKLGQLLIWLQLLLQPDQSSFSRENDIFLLHMKVQACNY